MFWDKIRECLSQYGEPIEWSRDFLNMESHDNICGLGFGDRDDGKDISIISHKYSYGGDEDLFEIIPSLDGDDVDGYLTEEEALNNINNIMNR